MSYNLQVAFAKMFLFVTTAFEHFIKFAKNKVRVAQMCRKKSEKLTTLQYGAGEGCPRLPSPNT